MCQQLKNKLKKGERLDDLLIDGRKIIQNPNLYTFTSDSVLLADFIKTKPSDLCVELCSGSGIIGILVALSGGFKKLYMVEVQKELACMCKRSLEINNLDDKIEVVNQKLQGINKIIGEEKFDIVFANPPFEKNIIEGENESQIIARCEKLVTIEEICFEAKKLLKFGGKFYCCFPSHRLFQLSYALAKNNIAIKDVSMILDAKGACRLVLVKAIKGGKSECVIKGIYK